MNKLEKISLNGYFFALLNLLQVGVQQFIRRFNRIALTAAILYHVDMVLPYASNKGEVLATHRPIELAWGRYVSSRIGYSKEEVVIHTTRGRIKVRPEWLGKIDQGDSSILYKTPLLRIPKKIYLFRQDKEVAVSNLLFEWFWFVPVLMVILAVASLRTSSKDLLLNLDSTNLVLAAVCLYLLIKDFVR